MSKRKKALSLEEVLLVLERLYERYEIPFDLSNPLSDPVAAQDVLLRAVFDGLVHLPGKRGRRPGPIARGPKIANETEKKRQQRYEKLMQDPKGLQKLIRDLWLDPEVLLKALKLPGHK
jgi:hypothetical protein